MNFDIDTVLPSSTDDWQLENKAAIEAYNEYIEGNGLFSDGVRQF